MGGKKKKAAKPIVKQPKYKVPDSWDCPLCGQKSAFHVKIDKLKKICLAQCRACKQPNPPYQVQQTPLTAKVDVFLKFYEGVLAQDRANLDAIGVTVHPTDDMRASLQDLDKRRTGFSTVDDDDEDDDGGSMAGDLMDEDE